MLLLKASSNSSLGTEAFSEKKKVYDQSSSLHLTKQVVEKSVWGKLEVEERQKEMAKIAVQTWPIQIS
jgi:hypothetical protein